MPTMAEGREPEGGERVDDAPSLFENPRYIGQKQA